MEVAAVAKRPFRVHRAGLGIICLITNLHLKNKKPPRLIIQDEGARGATWVYR